MSCPRNKHIFRCDQNGPPARRSEPDWQLEGGYRSCPGGSSLLFGHFPMTAERSNRIGAINSEPFSAVMACRRLRPGLRLRASLRGTIVADGSLRANRALLVAHGPPRTRVPEGRSKIGRRFSAGFLRFQIDPVPEGRGERCEQKMIRVAVFAEKTDVFLSLYGDAPPGRRCKRPTPSPRPSGTGCFFILEYRR